MNHKESRYKLCRNGTYISRIFLLCHIIYAPNFWLQCIHILKASPSPRIKLVRRVSDWMNRLQIVEAITVIQAVIVLSTKQSFALAALQVGAIRQWLSSLPKTGNSTVHQVFTFCSLIQTQPKNPVLLSPTHIT